MGISSADAAPRPRAVDRRLGRTVAVKELLRHNESNEARFMREALSSGGSS